MNKFVRVPVKILTPKIPNKQNSVFYAGNNIASVKLNNKTYVLVTAGHYSFSLKENNISFDSDRVPDQIRKILSKLTDQKIKTLSISNWGWFSINVWETHTITLQEEFLGYPTDVYSKYDEALKAFIKFVEKDLEIT